MRVTALTITRPCRLAYREQLIEMVVRQKEELNEVQEKNDELEQTRSSLVNESSMLSKDLESAKGKIDELMTEEGRM